MIVVRGRVLVIPNNERYIGVVQDDNSEVRHFQIERAGSNGFDLSGLHFTLDIAGVSPNSVALEKEITSRHIILTWHITKSQARTPGTLFIAIRAIDDHGTVRWGSNPGAVYIDETVNNTGYYETNPGDSLTQFEQFEVEIRRNLAKLDELTLKHEANEREIARQREEVTNAINAMSAQIGEALGRQTEEYNKLKSDTNTKISAAMADFELAKIAKFQEVDECIVLVKGQLSDEVQQHHDNLAATIQGYQGTIEGVLQGQAAILGKLETIESDYAVLKDYKAKDGEWIQRLGEAEKDLREAFETIRSLRSRIEDLESGGGSGGSGSSVDLGPITGRLNTLESDVGYLKDADRIFVWGNDELVADDWKAQPTAKLYSRGWHAIDYEDFLVGEFGQNEVTIHKTDHVTIHTEHVKDGDTIKMVRQTARLNNGLDNKVYVRNAVLEAGAATDAGNMDRFNRWTEITN